MNNIKTLKPHISLNVTSVQNSIDFYGKLFGIAPAKVRTGYAKFDVQNPPLNLALNEFPTTENCGVLSHLGIQVATTEDVLAAKILWENAGIATRDEMRTNCCYALQDKIWACDPDGNEWEVFVVMEDNLAETSMCCVPNEYALSDISLKEQEISANSADSCCPLAAKPVGINRIKENSCC